MKKVLMLCAAAVTLSASGITAFAAEGGGHNPSFQAKYQANLKTEANLWSRVQTNPTNSNIVQLKSVVTNLNSQAATLYASEQSLATEKASLQTKPWTAPLLKVNISKLEKQRDSILAQTDAAWHLVIMYWVLERQHGPGFLQLENQWKKDGKGYGHPPVALPLSQWTQAATAFHSTFGTMPILKENGNAKAWLHLAIQEHNKTQKELRSIDKQLWKAEHSKMDQWSVYPFDHALSTLQKSILRLQTSEITYTRMILQLQSATNTNGTTYGQLANSSSVSISETNTAMA
ncbi:MAG: hypothetical protein OWS03_05955 [Alicyclobacillaceae bacterium]|nr:hypothetical protein [Alicyclobacillaceae bacterium]